MWERDREKTVEDSVQERGRERGRKIGRETEEGREVGRNWMLLECGCRVDSAALEAWQLTAIEPDLA